MVVQERLDELNLKVFTSLLEGFFYIVSCIEKTKKMIKRMKKALIQQNNPFVAMTEFLIIFVF